MTMKSNLAGRGLRTAAASAAGLALALGTAAGATAAPGESARPDDAGRSVPASKISIQMFSLIPWVQQDGLDSVLGELAAMGYRNIEPFSGNFAGYTAEEFAALLKKHGLKASASHNSTNEATWDQTLDYAKTIGQHYVGSGGFASPGIGSYENTLATAETLNRLGEAASKRGLHKIFGHNHQQEFTTKYVVPETGELKSAWEIIADNTDPRYVTFELDVLWAADAGVDVVALLEEYGDRIELLHVKDGFLNGDARATFADVGEGEIEWEPILQAAHGKVRYYTVEYDLAPNGREFAADSFEFLSSLTY
ncbi:sugar phosphate isomerase/epimerase [Isoptericola variabilis]|uniref:Xylose isomerase domain-containing protein TIM barrel n=1 Tax=Isoptericola variabilis (strain 225) TaxID=743718 RepID=F6FWE3_ISOV2|nr:sugar phosphate isomerase/epimerase [Isoptericola variabilis]AEG44517.1 Xylose isomerase domain-containing protein TIM barrel [Isoptericola variabilis 225]TWH26567.1 sugar phosphate isomerase/epimerase [Isoptericola variabilis J7]